MELLEWMGKRVHVEIDRPMGCCHNGCIYPVNYGYIPGTVAGDEEPQDVYILGVSEPIASFDGWIIGAIHRKNDCEDKLVAAPEGMLFHQGQILQAVQFQEQYFDTQWFSVLHKSCGVVPYRRVGEQREFLLLLQHSGTWSFPKGHMEPGETELQTALRELKEETGLTARLEPDARSVCTYEIPPYIQKEVVLFLGQVQGDVFTQETEIASHRWVTEAAVKNYLLPSSYASFAQLLP